MKVRALQTLMLGPGTVLTLSEQQARDRAHVLADAGDGRVRTLGEVCFKAGEEFSVDVALPKALAEMVETDFVAPLVAADVAPVAAKKSASKRVPASRVNPAALDIG